ncbi:hypothetical protein, partial [Shewanella sp. GutDb-MelDb]|uniref:hypothetical protein n=1 Tax=Shewanella sp. GutDb-MelDb TaxID=2058316 RepID=UPI0021537A09
MRKPDAIAKKARPVTGVNVLFSDVLKADLSTLYSLKLFFCMFECKFEAADFMPFLGKVKFIF